MLQKLILKNFRQHEYREFNFKSGINALHGANESGKSTVIQAVLYALFGSGALEESLHNVVTWGKKENELEVELVIQVNRKLYKYQRSKSGAEIYYDGGMVVGQKECNLFSGSILGGDLATINKLMIANQNNVRGALSDGARAVTTFLEELGDFDLFERIEELAKDNWLTGTTNPLQQRILEIERQIEGIDINVPDTSILDSSIKESEGKAEGFLLEHAKLIDELDVNKQQMVKASNDVDRRNDEESKLVTLERGVINRRKQIQECLKMIDAKPDMGLIIETKKEIEDLSKFSSIRRLYDSVVSLKATEYWEGDKQSLEIEIDRVTNQIEQDNTLATDYSDVVSKLRQESRLVRSKIVTGTHCPICKSVIVNLEETKKANEVFQAEVDKLETQANEYENKAIELRKQTIELAKTQKTLNNIDRVTSKYIEIIYKAGSYIKVDNRTVPPKVDWVADIPMESSNIKFLENKLKSLQQQLKDSENAEARHDTLVQVLTTEEHDVDTVKEILAKLATLDLVNSIRQKISSTQNRLKFVQESIESISTEIIQLKSNKEQILNNYNRNMEDAHKLYQQINTVKQDIQIIQFHNQILKKVKLARPLIGNKLWNMVLSSVSSMFSDIRKVESIVVKDEDGFKVNGQSVSSLSGSTKDMLGLTIRVALMKTFIPSATFMILDEASAGCDESRTEAMLAFMSACGLPQVIIISHEAVTETVASNIIEI